MEGMGIFIKLVIDINFLSPYFQEVPRQADHAFNEIPPFILRKFENDDVSSLRNFGKQNDIVKQFDIKKRDFVGDMRAITEFGN